MNMIFKLVFFSIFLNIGMGILAVAIPGLDTIAVTDQNANVVEWEQGLNSSADSMTAIVSNTGLFSFLGLGDFAVLKFVTSFLTHLKDFAFGFIVVLDRWFGAYLIADNPALYNLLFGALYTMASMAYALGLFYLFTNKRVDDYG
jgi:hypothetical protein